MQNLIKKTWFQISLLGILIFISYFNILQNGFVWDDTDFIINRQATGEINLVQFFRGQLPVGHEGVYRPVRTLIYALVYPLFNLNPFLYHLHGIILHIIISLSVLKFLTILTENKFLAYSSSLLFALHPVQTESVSFATINFDIYSGLFVILTLIFYLNAQKTGKIRHYCLSLFFATIAQLSGEMALILAPLVIIVHLYKNFPATRLSGKITSPYILAYFLITFLYSYLA